MPVEDEIDVKDTDVQDIDVKDVKDTDVQDNKEIDKPDNKDNSILKSLVDKIASLEEKLAEKKPKEVDKPEDKKEDVKDDKVDKSSELSTFKDEIEQIKDEVKKKNKVVSEYEGVLKNIIDTKLADVSDDLKALIPESLNVKEKLDWILKAEKAGIFGRDKKGSIEIGKPLNPKDTKQPVDDSKLSASAKMALAYESSKKKK